jgi:hypothetical protein
MEPFRGGVTIRFKRHDLEYIVGSSKELKLSKTRPTLKEALESGRYGVLRRIGDFALMKKGHSTEGNAQLLEDWAL